MALIDNEEAARRLARVIISDIELYEKKKLHAGDDLTTQMAEGRALFRRRVVPELAAIFETVVEAKRSGASTGGPNALTPSPVGTPRRAPEPAVVEARLDDARPVEAVQSESTARTDLTAEAAATRNPDLLDGRIQPRQVGQDDRTTPVPVEDIVAGRSRAPEAAAITWGAKDPEGPGQDALQGERVTSRVAFPAVTETPEEPPIGARPPARPPTPPPAHTLVPSRPPTPQPIAVRREAPATVPQRSAEKTPVPLSVALAAAPPSPRPPALPSQPAVPFLALETLPVDALAAPASPSAAPDDVVNLRAKTSKVRVLLYVVATAGGLALIGRFLTRFL